MSDAVLSILYITFQSIFIKTLRSRHFTDFFFFSIMVYYRILNIVTAVFNIL